MLAGRLYSSTLGSLGSVNSLFFDEEFCVVLSTAKTGASGISTVWIATTRSQTFFTKVGLTRGSDVGLGAIAKLIYCVAEVEKSATISLVICPVASLAGLSKKPYMPISFLVSP